MFGSTDSYLMGPAMWIGAGLIAAALARLVRPGRTRRWLAESITALFTAVLLGVATTALDFGGWRELDWRAGTFAFIGAVAMIGLMRMARMIRERGPRHGA